jgi:flap endonuclease-1
MTKGLNKLLTKKYTKAMTSKPVTDYRGKTVVVDLMQVLYRFGIAVRKTGKDITTIEGRNVGHIHGLLINVLYYVRLGVNPVYVFDGRSPELKKRVLNIRRNARKKAEENYERNPESTKDFQKSYMIRPEYIADCKELLDALGIRYIQALSEADAQMAYMSKTVDEIYGVVSDDIDILVFGSKKLLRHFYGKNESVTEISLDNLLNTMNEFVNIPVTYDKFVEYSILLGNDFYPKIRGIHSEDMLEVFAADNYDTKALITRVKAQEDNMLDEYDDIFDMIKDYYINSRVHDVQLDDIMRIEPNRKEIYNVMKKSCFSTKKIYDTIEMITTYYLSFLSEKRI